MEGVDKANLIYVVTTLIYRTQQSILITKSLLSSHKRLGGWELDLFSEIQAKKGNEEEGQK